MKSMNYISVAAIVLMGVAFLSCSKDENLGSDVESPEIQKGNTVTLTATVSREESPATKALTAAGVKTFAIGETIAVAYWNNSGNKVVAISEALKEENIVSSNDPDWDKKTAHFTVSLTDPDYNKDIKYIYPSYMAKEGEGDNIDWGKLYNEQDGKLTTLASQFDLATGTGSFTSTHRLPSIGLTNQLAILAFTKVSGITGYRPEGTDEKSRQFNQDIIRKVTKLTIKDWNRDITYTVNRTVGDGPIYVAVQEINNGQIGYDVEAEQFDYHKGSFNKVYAANNIYPLRLTLGKEELKAVNLSRLKDSYDASNGDVLTGKLNDSDNKINIGTSSSDEISVTLKDVDIQKAVTDKQTAGITCMGNITIILEGENNVRGIASGYPAIYINETGTLTIKGTAEYSGILKAYGNDAAAIGAVAVSDSEYSGGTRVKCGKIIIESGRIYAYGGDNGAGIGGSLNSSCGGIEIWKGEVFAQGGYNAAGIGSGYVSPEGPEQGGIRVTCGTILIKGGTVQAVGSGSAAGIGCSRGGEVDGITITDQVTSVTATRGSAQNAKDCIGRATTASNCGDISIGGTVYWNQTDYVNGGETYLGGTAGSLVYQPGQ